MIAARHHEMPGDFVFKHAFIAVAILLCSPGVFADQRQNYPFSVETVREGSGHRIVARNGGPAAVSVAVSIADSRNVSANRPFPVYAVVPAGSGTFELARIRPAVPGVGHGFRVRSTWLLGDFNARPNPDASYRLPYRDGLAFHIGQAPGSRATTHTEPESRYAVDIAMPEGTPVVAARDGVVIYTEARQVYGGQSPDLRNRANAVRIRHADGTMALYAHLAHDGVQVYPGQLVTAGRQIGLSGSTGYSSGPHLHFAVQTVARRGDGLTTVSLPFQFYVGNPPAVFSPRFGMYAAAQYSSPGRAPVVFAPARPGQPPAAGRSGAGGSKSP